ncbi:MAG: ATP-binding protein, partial [Myxococcales bacterium]|nr:ATP-binding protein [Myxococcales bacterium]
VENAIDAGATRIEIELEDGGREGIRVVDDGRGIHRDDLPLAVTRHATSKLSRPDQLVEIVTLGFRGEALASIAAVARLEIRSRRLGEAVGHRLALIPGARPALEPIGMPPGTIVEIGKLFANVPARRKFLRSEATEVGHCVDAVTRAALVHPTIHFKLRHGGRELLDLPACGQGERVSTVLARRGGSGPYLHFRGEAQGVQVEGWFAPPSSATRQRSASFVVVRRRVVSERTLAAVLKQAYGEALPRGTHPVACLFVDPPRGSVDVNVHPQKSEVRFPEAQEVFAAVREVVESGLANAPWHGGPQLEAEEDGPSHGWARPRFAAGEGDGGQDGVRAALAGWSRRGGLGGELPSAREQGTGYRLGTRAVDGDYAGQKRDFRGEVDRLRGTLRAGADLVRDAPMSRRLEQGG